MRFKEDYSYITGKANKIIEMGLANLDLHSIRIDAFISDEQKEENRKLAKILSIKEWGMHCDEFEKLQNKKTEKILDILSEHFKIYQYKDKNIQYRNRNCLTKQNGYEWDLFCNFGDKRDARLSFNNMGKTLEQRYEDLNKIKEILKNYQDNDVVIYIQYTQNFNIEELKKNAIESYTRLNNIFVNYNGMIGKIKPVQEYHDSYYGTTCMFGFFKKGSKKKFYRLSNIDIAIM